MVRRWSCLIDINNNFNTCNSFKKGHKINLFKSSVNFKRFTFKFTKFKRKSLIRLKHRSNWLIYTNVIKLWVKDYIFNKNYLRYQFFNKIFINNFFFYNFNFIKNRNESFFYNFNFIFYVFTNKNFFYFFKHKPSFSKYTPLSFAWTYSNPSVNTSILPVYSQWDNHITPYNSFKTPNYELNDMFDFFLSLTLKKTVEIKKILTLLFYFNILKFKNVK